MNLIIVMMNNPMDGAFSMASKTDAPQSKFARHRRGVARKLDEIKASVEALREDVHAALATRADQHAQEDNRHAS